MYTFNNQIFISVCNPGSRVERQTTLYNRASALLFEWIVTLLWEAHDKDISLSLLITELNDLCDAFWHLEPLYGRLNTQLFH